MLTDKLIWLRHQVNKRLIGNILPLSWFGPLPPAANELSASTKPVHLQIVSHCWQYSHMLNFQLSSIINHPPQNFKLTYTLYHCKEDTALVELINRVEQLNVPNLSWDWVAVPKEQLFRRAIGRNKSALISNADWIWFSDCDLIFHEHCLESLSEALVGRQERLVFPKEEFITELLAADHPMLNQSNDATVDIDPTLFYSNTITKAKGAFQIVHGDVARACGYCDRVTLYQKPMQHWSKTYEDSIFRQLINSEGTPIDVVGLYRIRHQEKGRYVKGKSISSLRRSIRMATDESGNKA